MALTWIRISSLRSSWGKCTPRHPPIMFETKRAAFLFSDAMGSSRLTPMLCTAASMAGFSPSLGMEATTVISPSLANLRRSLTSGPLRSATNSPSIRRRPAVTGSPRTARSSFNSRTFPGSRIKVLVLATPVPWASFSQATN